MIREIIHPTTENYTIVIPKEYLNKDVELLIIPLDSKNGEDSDKMRKLEIIRNSAGLIKKEDFDPIKWQDEIRDKWNERSKIFG